MLFVVENTFNQEDKIFASWLRKNCHDKEILLVQNKIDRKEKEEVGIFGFKKSFKKIHSKKIVQNYSVDRF